MWFYIVFRIALPLCLRYAHLQQPSMTGQVMQVQQVISRSRAILVRCMIVQLWRAIVCCDIAKRRQQSRVDSLHYVIVAEAASARFKKLHLQGKIFDSDILALMARLEEGLTGTADDLSARVGKKLVPITAPCNNSLLSARR